jgi:predicted nuclease with TOPRIM domain
MNYEKIKKQFNGKKIGEIETEAGRHLKNSQHSRAEFIKVLYYLQRTRRFRENAKYKVSTFADYIQNEYNLTASVFEKEKWVYLHFEKEADIIGAGRVARIKQDCGNVRGKKVIKELLTLKKQKPKQFTLQKIDEVIEKNTKYKKPANAGGDKTGLQRQLQQLREENRSLHRELAERIAQIEKLKETLKKREAVIKLLEKEINDYGNYPYYMPGLKGVQISNAAEAVK